MARCECCETCAVGVPQTVYNRPSLGAVSYRVGTFADFRQTLLEDSAFLELVLDGQHRRSLEKWTARDRSDFGVLTFELWAYLADILSFYNERTINEAFLRTARLRASVVRLAALLGYQPAAGVAASALLAFEVERGRRLDLPLGLRVQSVPGPDEKPQKFETIEALQMDAALNRVCVLPPPGGYEPFRLGHSEALLDPTPAYTPPLAPGQTLVLFSTGSTAVTEDKRIESISSCTAGRRLRWTPPVQYGANAVSLRLYRYSRKLRLFGANAPATYLVGTAGANPIELTWESAQTAFVIGPDGIPLSVENSEPGFIAVRSSRKGKTVESDYPDIVKRCLRTVYLDGVYDDLRTGQRVLVSTPSYNILAATLTDVAQGQVSVGPLATTVTRISFEFYARARSLPGLMDLREVVVYVLDEPEIQCLEFDYPGRITGKTIQLQLDDAGGLVPGRRVVFDDQAGRPVDAKVVGVAPATTPTSGFVSVTIDPSLDASSGRDLDAATAFLYGNVASATHGEKVVNEIVGDGDAGRLFQTLRLAKSPVTYVPAAGAPHGAASTLELRVDSVRWHEVPTLYGHGPGERIFVTTRDDDQVTTICGGDGTNGACFPTGRANLAASYRVGLGETGIVDAGTLRTPLDRPVGLKGVSNPLPSSGGADPETLDQARANAPNTVRTFGRIVSLTDFEDAAREFAGVAKAAAAWEWDGEERVVNLIVVGVNGAELDDEVRKILTDDLNTRRTPHVKLSVAAHERVPVRIKVAILIHSDYLPGRVQEAVHQALCDRFAFERVELGQTVFLSDIYRLAQRVAGVTAADVNEFRFENQSEEFLTDHGATAEPTQLRLRLRANELPVVRNPVHDVAVKLGLT
ncbi:MAG: putative baseplate assembly protein [Phycisphaerae bacterium]|nr:putative baseplate assembly protein [Phycisphaerae bacterium]